MKKYLMMAVAGLAIASCSKMDDYATSPAEIVQAKYNQAFFNYVKGKIDPEHTWGFGDDVYSNAPAFDFTRSVDGITFPTFKDGQCPSMPTKYKNTLAEAITAGAKYAKDYQNYQKGDIIYINSDYQSLNSPQNTEDLTIYVDGTVTYLGGTNQNGNGTTICVTEGSTLKLGSVSERLTIYLAPNATLDISKGLKENVISWWPYEAEIVETGNNTFTFTKENAALYMSAGSTVKGTNIYFKDGYTVLNEGGTIETGDLHVENGAVLYNKNQITATGVIALRNTNGEIDNFGTMTGASMTLDANARFYNVAGGEVNISGLTKINNNAGNNAWQNSGQFNTGSFEITGGCSVPVAFNNCHMTVTGKFFMNHGNFVLDGGAAVECGSFEWQSDNYFHMGGKALLKVTGELLANNQNTGYGFYGDGTEYAVIQAGSVKKGSSGKFRAAYFGNLFIDTNDHFTQGENSADGTWYTFGDNVKFSFTDNTDVSGYQTHGAKTAQKATNFSIDIPADNAGCTPGYKYTPGNPPSTPQNDPNKIRIIAEDLSAGGGTDFDFNDVVLDVTFGSPATVILTHAGGTLPLRINGNNANEVHKLFGVWQGDDAIDENTPDQQMVNTNRGPSKPSVDLTNVLNVSISSRSEADTKLKLEVYKQGSWIEMTSPKGEPACKLAVGQDFRVLDEQVSIKGRYPKFLDWVKGEKFSSQWWTNE